MGGLCNSVNALFGSAGLPVLVSEIPGLIGKFTTFGSNPNSVGKITKLLRDTSRFFYNIPHFCWVTYALYFFVIRIYWISFNPITRSYTPTIGDPKMKRSNRSTPKLGFLREYSTLRRDEDSWNIVFASFHCRKLQAALPRQLEEALRRLDARVERAAGTALQCSEGALRLSETDADHRWWKKGRPNNLDDVIYEYIYIYDIYI